MEIFWYYLAALLSLLLTFNHFFKPGDRKLPPSPFALPVIGHLHLMIKNSPTESLQRLSSKHGPILFLRFGSQRNIVVSSPSAVEDCFTNNDVVFADRPRSLAGDCLTYNYTAVVWAPYGHLWRNLRRLLVVELFSAKSLHRSSIIREEETRNLLSHLFRISSRGETPTLDLKYWFTLLASNIVTRLVAGERYVRDEDAGTELGKKSLERIKEMFLNVTPTNLCDFLPILRWIDYKGVEKSLMRLQKKRDEFLQGLVDEYRRKKSRNSDTGDNNRLAMIGTLLFLQESEPEFYTHDLVKSIILVLFLGGIGTSSSTMEWAISLLLNHPEAFHKLRAEIDGQVGHSRLLNELDLADLPFLHCVINETLRLHPPAPLLLPRYSSDDCVVGGYEVPQGTTLLVNAWALHRDPNVWEEPNKFRPERFEAMERGGEGFKFVPFGAGRRACPGANMGVRAISLAVGALVQCFELENVGQKKKGGMGQGIDQGLEVLCIPRQNALELFSLLQI